MTGQNILVVDDDLASMRLMSRIVSRLGETRVATNGADALKLAREAAPDLMLLDAELPGMSGFQVCEEFRADKALAEVPVIIVTSHGESSFEIAGFEIGASDFIAKPVNPQLVVARVKAQLRVKFMADELRRLSAIDALTGVANRRRFDEALENEWQRGSRNGQPTSLLMIDVDHFKLFNDRYGHPSGDACLRSVAQALVQTSMRPGDLASRYGGDKFTLLLPHTQRSGAGHLAQQVLHSIEALAITHERSPTARHVTVSIGVGCYDDKSVLWRPRTADSRFGSAGPDRCVAYDLVAAADKALHVAKSAGRAQAKLLDIADLDAPILARDVGRAQRLGKRPPV